MNRQKASQMGWISIKNKLPEQDGAYLIFAKTADPDKPFINIAWYEPKEKDWSLIPECFVSAISHWMSLPKPPKE